MNLPLTTPPSWAYDYCYFFYFLAVIQFFAGAYAIAKIVGKSMTVAAILALSITINCLTTLMLFWMCRGALRREYFDNNMAGACPPGKRMMNGMCV
jgi:hypothetical protein